MKINNFALIIGAMKCGTTSLFNYLAQHPEIAPCSTKEPAFFAKKKLFNRGFDYYQNLWMWDETKHKIALEASTAYSRSTHPYYLNSATNIQEYQKYADFKFIYIVRDPLERIEAHYNHGLAYDFPECQGVSDQYINQEILDTSKYAMQIERYYSLFEKEDILLINFNDLKSDPSLVLQKVCNFLGVDSSYNFENLGVVHNLGKERKKINFLLWKYIKKKSWATSLIQSIPSSYKTKIRNLVGKKTNRNFKLSVAQELLIADHVREDLSQLSRDYNLEIEDWKLSEQLQLRNSTECQ